MKTLTGHSLQATAQIKTMGKLVGDIVDELEKNARMGFIVLDPVQLIRAKVSLEEGFDQLEKSIGGRKIAEN